MKGYKYLFIATIILFAVVFLLTHFIKRNEDTDVKNNTASQTSTAVSSETASTDKIEEDDADIDNIWAMFLVNSKNPLPDNYDSIIKTKLVYTGDREYYMDERMADYMIRMISDAKKDGVNLELVSAYRTFEYQQQNFDKSVQDRIDNRGMTYDEAYEDTKKEVAMPGESEHNAGLSADIMSDEYSSLDDDGFKNTKAYKWLTANAANYGFILRYPTEKSDYTGIIYEPWHYRFVGVYYAKKINESGMCLEEYFESQGWLDKNGKAIDMLGPCETQTSQTTASTSQASSTQSVTIIV